MVFQLGNHQNERTNWRRFFKVRRFNAEDAEAQRTQRREKRQKNGDVKSPLHKKERCGGAKARMAT
jgi:hypothetical protein